MGRPQRGAAAVDFVLALMVVVPLVLGIVHIALLLHVRNTLVAAASDGARAAAAVDGDEGLGIARTREQLGMALSERFVADVSARMTTRDGIALVEVEIAAKVPPLGIWGPATVLHATGHAVREGSP